MSNATIIDGKAAAAAVRATVAHQVATFKARHGVSPGLTVVLVGDDPASQVYVRSKGKQTIEAGMHSEQIKLPADTSQDEVLAVVRRLNADTAVHGILVQLPLPKQISELAVISTIDPDKDVDGLHPMNAGRLALGQDGFVPCTPLGCLLLLRQYRGDLTGLRALVLGRSNLEIGRASCRARV